MHACMHYDPFNRSSIQPQNSGLYQWDWYKHTMIVYTKCLNECEQQSRQFICASLVHKKHTHTHDRHTYIYDTGTGSLTLKSKHLEKRTENVQSQIVECKDENIHTKQNKKKKSK